MLLKRINTKFTIATMISSVKSFIDPLFDRRLANNQEEVHLFGRPSFCSIYRIYYIKFS